MKSIFNLLTRIFSKFSDFQLQKRKRSVSSDMDSDFRQIFEECEPYSMTSMERMYALFKAVKYIIENNIPGDFVECGVWRGGSSMIIASTLKLLNITDRKIYLYDTFEGMPKPGENDNKFRGDIIGQEVWKKEQKKGGWLVATQEEVKNNLTKIDYPEKNLVFVKGMVEETIPKIAPEQISLLRLDTDFFDSTYHEFVHLYPKLSEKGILIIDDYGSWKGSREATDKYFKENNISLYLNRIDTGVVGIKN